MANTRFLNVLSQALSDTGTPLSGAKLYFYESGTSTPKTTYSDEALTTANLNPLPSDSAGRFGNIFLASGSYKIVFATSAGVTIKTMDPVDADVITTSAFMETLLDDTTAAAALTTLGVSSFMQGVLDDATAAAAQSTLGLAGAAAWRNLLINGDFRIHQRGSASVTATANFVCDRWLIGASGGSRTVTRGTLSDADRTAIGREDARYYLQYAATGGSSSSHFEALFQRIEGGRTLAGSNGTLSFWAKRTAGTGNIAVELYQGMGTGGSPSADVSTGGTVLTLTTDWQRFTVNFAVPSLTGATFGTNEDAFLSATFFLSGGSDYNTRTGSLGVQTVTVQIADVMLEPGASASAFVSRPLAAELAMCMRYFETSNPGGTYQTFTTNDGGAESATHPSAGFAKRVPFRVPKRAAPTVITYDAAAGSNKYSYYDGTWKNNGTWASGPAGALGGFFIFHATASTTSTEFGWQASAEL